MSQYTQWDFINLVEKHDVRYHEKTLGQLFCDKSAKDIVALLLQECTATNVSIELNSEVLSVDADEADVNAPIYKLTSSNGVFSCQSLVIATGGLSIPTLGGASGFGYKLATQFGLDVSKTEASLVPFTLS